MDSRFKEWVYIEGLMQSAYHEAALKMNLSDSEFWILYVFNFHQEGCNQSVLYKEACLTKSTVNSAIRKMEQKDLLYLTPGEGRNTMVFLTGQVIKTEYQPPPTRPAKAVSLEKDLLLFLLSGSAPGHFAPCRL